MFEKASRLKLRFDTPNGRIGVEDLWDLPLISSRNIITLDNIAKAMYKKLQECEVSFVSQTKSKEGNQLAFDIVKHIIDVRLKEAEQIRIETETRQRNQRIMALINMKEEEQLASLPVEQLKEMIK